MKRNRLIRTGCPVLAILVAIVYAPGCRQEAEPTRGAFSVEIRVSFKLDPRMLGPAHAGERWVSPPSYGPIQYPVDKCVVEARAEAVDSQGQRHRAKFEWIAEDPEMVKVSPGQGDAVTIHIQRAGESRLQVTSRGVSQTLNFKAFHSREDIIALEITQQPESTGS